MNTDKIISVALLIALILMYVPIPLIQSKLVSQIIILVSAIILLIK
jgi:hypothetical protein